MRGSLRKRFLAGLMSSGERLSVYPPSMIMAMSLTAAGLLLGWAVSLRALDLAYLETQRGQEQGIRTTGRARLLLT